MENKSDMKDLEKECRDLLSSCDSLDKELKEQHRCVEFLLNEYKTNKKWFRDLPGRVTIEDVIKAAFEFGWASKRQFDYNNK